MKEVFTMWRDTRMVVLTALSAAVYAAVLIPLKPIPLIPGFTEIRPANSLPIVFSLLFGPAGAWGAAFGNLIGDFFGTLGAGSLFGFAGNFFYGFLPYKIWSSISKEAPIIKGSKQWSRFLGMVFLASAACAIIIGWGVHILGMIPFSALANIILINNFLVATCLSPMLLFILYPRVKKWGFVYQTILEDSNIQRGKFANLGIVLLWVGALGGLVLGNFLSLRISGDFIFGLKAAGNLGLGLGLMPAITLLIVGAFLL